ncbi:MAG: transglutaminase-like domain-containing protein [Oscillospiraceae bacterium]|nr:transglutaminase-like domain-containing protein [Oscillospiraceae bacterium]
MKKEMRFLALALVAMMMLVMIAACTKETTAIHAPGEDEFDDNDFVYMDLASEMIPLTEAPPLAFSAPTAPGTLTKSNNKAIIDYSNSKDGYIMVKFMSNTNKQLRVLITGPSNVQYQYTLKQDTSYEVYPLSDGNGKYTIGVYEQTEGNRYSTALSATIDVALTDEFAPFLRPNQYVNFTAESNAVAKAAELVEDSTGTMEKVAAIYDFVVAYLSYDRIFAREVTQGKHNGYLPDIDQVLANRKGICFDYAALMTAMVRSQGIPCRLVVGYAGKDYHAWIDVYNEETGEWVNTAIYFDGKEWNRMDPTFASTSNQSNAIMQFIGDGANYSARFLY